MTTENRLFLAPLLRLRTVLDLGTGTGNWAIEVGMYSQGPCTHFYKGAERTAERFPESRVVGW